MSEDEPVWYCYLCGITVPKSTPNREGFICSTECWTEFTNQIDFLALGNKWKEDMIFQEEGIFPPLKDPQPSPHQLLQNTLLSEPPGSQ
jgi:hypothetical protein